VTHRPKLLSKAGETPPPLSVETQIEEIEDEAGAADMLRTVLWAQAQEIARQEKERGND
jgi:hypothetical protein